MTKTRLLAALIMAPIAILSVLFVPTPILAALSAVSTLGAWSHSALAQKPLTVGIIYVGPGLGIAVSGFAATAMVAMDLRAATGWAVFALLALVLTALAWPQLRGAVQVSAGMASHEDAPRRGTIAAFTLAYGLAGFGYIVTATFLPVIARQALPGSVWLDLFWPIFGIGVAVGALLTVRLPVL